jgi:hypothetical protein
VPIPPKWRDDTAPRLRFPIGISGSYGGAKPSELLEANEIVCGQFLDKAPELW